jgi:tripartite-type tricarboxylate transporter receptor subunit TctC
MIAVLRAPLAFIALIVASLLVYTNAHAQSYPAKPIRIIVPYPPGGGTDIVARLIAQKVGDSLGRPVIVDNRAGANGVIGTEAAAKAAPDGYTLGMATPGPVTVAKGLIPNLGYDPERDFAPVILANASANVLAIHPSVPARSVKEFVSLARNRSMHVGVSAIGSVQHLLAVMLNRDAKAKLEIITYKGGAQVATDVAGGQIESMWNVLPVVLPLLQGGRIRALAVASEKRSALLPHVPTMREAGWPSVLAVAWNGVVAPAGTPRNIVMLLNKEIARSLDAPDVKERYAALGMESIGGSPEDFGKFLRAETEKWTKLVKDAQIKSE